MPHGSGESEVQRKIFVGKGSLLLPSLRKPSPLPHESAAVFSADDGPPSPCSSTTLSCFSTTSDEACFGPENSFLKHNLNAFGHPYKPRGHHSIYSFASPLPKVCKLSGIENQGAKMTSNRKSVAINRAYTPTEEDFVAATERGTERTKISSLTVLRAVPKVSNDDIGHTEVSSLTGMSIGPKKTTSDAIAKQNTLAKSLWSEISSNGTSSSFLDSKRYASTPNVFSTAHQLPYNFVPAVGHHTPPPDFIGRKSTTADNVHTISAQPDLSVMLSGAVRSCALLKDNPDFVPFAVMPRDKARRKSRSLSDMSIQKEKTARFLDRRKVIRMDLDDKECCSHTEVAPSSMMTLALELLVSKDNKAAALFEEAKKKANNASDGKDSILPSLWVVPKAPSPDFAAKTASHLQPTVKNSCKIQLQFGKNSTIARSTKSELGDQIATDKAVGSSAVCEFSTKSLKNLKAPVHDPSEKISQYKGEKIRSVDVERDLRTLTVADLVGSPDTVFTEQESKVDIADCSTKSLNASTERSKYQLAKKLSSAAKTTSANLRKNSYTEKGIYFETISSDSKTKGTTRASEETPSCSSPSAVCAQFANSKDNCGSNRRSSCQSNSSSLTTVSSLSLSSGSVGSIEGPAKASKLCHIYHDRDNAVNTSAVIKADDGNFQKDDAIKSPKVQEEWLDQNCARLPETKPTAVTNLPLCSQPHDIFNKYFESESTSSKTAPRPAQRSKSFGVVDKIHKNGCVSKVSDKPLLNPSDFGAENKNALGRSWNNLQDAVYTSSLSNSISLNADLGGVENHNCSLQSSQTNRASDVEPEERHRSALLISNASRKLFVGAPPETHHKCHSQTARDTRGKSATHTLECGGISTGDDRGSCKGKISKTAQDCREEIPTQTGPCLATEPVVDIPTCDDTTSDMTTETLFRNGEISVVGGSKVTLVKKAHAEPSNPDHQQKKADSDLYLSDIIYNAEDKLCSDVFGGYREKPAEEDFVQPTWAEQVGSYQPSELHTEKSTANSSEDTVFERFRQQPRAAETNTSPVALKHSPPSYTGVEASKTIGIKMGTKSHNACAKPFGVNITSHLNRSPLKASSNIRPSFPTGSQPQQRRYVASNKLSDDNAMRVEQAGGQTGHSRYNEEFNCPRTDILSAGEHEEDEWRTVANRTAASYGKDSAGNFFAQEQNVYSSSVKIMLNRSKSRDSIGVRKWENLHGPLSLHAGSNAARKSPAQYISPLTRRNSFPAKEERRRNFTNVRGAITPDMKVPEEVVVKPDAPQHSAVDEGDFAGVVDGPTKNVGEIRAMFKGPDFPDYAKPKLVAKKPPPPNAKPKLRTEKIASVSNRNSAEVAQQVIGLFKDALTLEDDAAVTPAPLAQSTTSNEIDTEVTECQTTVKDKVASFNGGTSPTKKQEINNNDKETIVRARDKSAESPPCAEIITNPATATNGHAKKAGVKQEKVLAESYDESLDQFYDVLDELTAS